MTEFDLDKILDTVGGWGRFQKLYYCCLCSAIAFSVFSMSYIFVARDVKYRCLVDSCGKENDTYFPDWLKNAVPFKEDAPEKCLRYIPKSNATCTDFLDKTETCNKFVYEKKQVTIVQEFDIHCDDNLWKLTIVGTISVLGEFCSLPVAGLLSDKFGRKSMVLISVFISTVAGVLRSFSISYIMYVILEFADTVSSSGMYSGAFILALEIVDTKRRSMGNSIICIAFALGQMYLGLITWLTPSWRTMLRVVYLPGFLITFVFWFTPESVRWLMSKNRFEEAWKILESIAKLNGIQLNKVEVSFPKSQPLKKISEADEGLPIKLIFRSKKLVIRILHCSFTWICCNFPYYGLAIQSVALSEDIYINFMAQAAVEVPAYALTYICLDRLGRRKSLAFSLILGGVACVTVDFVAGENWLALVIFLCGKFFITMAYTTLYVYTAEMFPTSSRHSAFSICSMFGRLGSMLAPQVPLLARVFKALPMIIFAGMALSAGSLAFFFPETHNKKLPDEVNEAEHIEENSDAPDSNP